jgi:hypothetical protein
MYARFAAVSLLLLLPSCNRRAELGPERSVPKEQRPLAWNVPDADRLGLAAPAPATAAAALYAATTPAGWTVLPPAMMRDLNWKAGDAECALLGEVRGTVEGNVNRWLGDQYGQPLLSAAEIDRLPAVQLLGAPGRLVEAEGTGGKQTGMKLLAIVADHGNYLSTLKMTGPKAAVDAQRTAFLALAPTIRRSTAADAAQGPSPEGASSTGANGGANSGTDSGAGAYEATLPAGWSELPPTPMRNLNLKVGDVECTFLGAVQGTVESNVNRWVQGQFGGTPLTPAQIDALPTSTLLGAQGRVVETTGTFQGKAGMKLLGIVAEHGGSISTLKMTGPAAAVDAQRAAFLALAPTIRARAAAVHTPAPKSPTTQGPTPQGPPAPAGGAGDAGPQPFTATAPPSWRAKTDSGKLLHYALPQGTEIYLGQLSGDLPSLATVWRGQMGQDPIDEAGIKKLPTARLLGADAVLIDLEGTLNDVTGGRNKPGYRMLLVALALGGSTTFVKCLGPAAEVGAQREAFLTFCSSIRRQP